MSENMLRLLLDARRARRGGPPAIVRRQWVRLAEMVAFARANSPYYRDLYRALPDRVEDPTLLPVTSKRALMPRFDEWVTDRAVRLDQVRTFVNQPELVGEYFLGKYSVATTSGTTGTPGIFVLDARSFTVTGVLAIRMLAAWLSAPDVLRIIARRGRMAMINATGGHFASAVAGVRLRRRRGRKVAVFPVSTPIAEIVAGLNRFRPALLAPYASMGALLASEQEAGRLRIDPVLVVLSAEGLATDEYERIAKAFGATVRDSYAATECPFLSYRCEHGWLHVNTDWVVLEPVNASYRRVTPGQRSHTVLVSNLANRVQPILRYDLGDSVVERPDACPCGSPFMAIQVQGRAADALTFRTSRGESVTLPPLLFATAVDRVPGVELFQIVQTTPTGLRVRVRAEPGSEASRVAHAVRAELRRLLRAHGLEDVSIVPADEPPEQSAGGKFRQITPLPTKSEPSA